MLPLCDGSGSWEAFCRSSALLQAQAASSRRRILLAGASSWESRSALANTPFSPHPCIPAASPAAWKVDIYTSQNFTGEVATFTGSFDGTTPAYHLVTDFKKVRIPCSHGPLPSAAQRPAGDREPRGWGEKGRAGVVAA